MTREIAVATITPSGNRTVEKVTQSLCQALPGVVPLFSRIPVHGRTSPVASPDGPYHWPSMESAAELLSHAAPAALCWNGSKGGDYGFDIDETLCRRLRDLTGLPTVTAALSVLELLGRFGATRIAVVTPYTAGVHARAVAGFRSKGFDVVGEAHADVDDNLAYGAIAPDAIADLARRALEGGGVQAVVFFCTNFHGAPAVPGLEAETGIPMIDSTAAGAWGLLRAAGVDTTPLARFGRIFSL
ncbi:aspartate/glutamate racemase family protein [uncultured Alsobacter sp.]|uniref:maleate cis-trans isomerase family protein n=1 Tax=uncultured Alsobacter sp. TaxID=1748258 RepID=UPI0025F6B032|nr:aspartate/glutamate racemase family protein [uncultured Alsobacter sp.]